jgi:hypothetical protein
MKISATKPCLIVTMLATAALSAGLIRAQDVDTSQKAADAARQVIQDFQLNRQSENSSTFGYSGSAGGSPFFSSVRTGPNVTSAIRKAAEAVRDAKGDEAKSAAQKKLAEVLSKSYDEDMVAREHELKQIEERLAKLRDLLERRRAKKQEIIDLQTKVALNEAEGLGFYESDRPAKTVPFTVTMPRKRVDVSSGAVIPAVPMPEASPSPPSPPSPPAANVPH